ncbi:MAG: hypothetical protein ACRD3W_00760, partial [Terriglobales bacterium]
LSTKAPAIAANLPVATKTADIPPALARILPLCGAFVPIPEPQPSFWDSSYFSSGGAALAPLWALFAVGLFALFALSFYKNRTALFIYCAGTIALLVSGVPLHAMRHAGVLFVLLVGGFWLANSRPAGVEPRWQDACNKVAVKVFNAVLIVQVAVAVLFFGSDILLPFSTGKKLALWIKSHHLEEMPILGTPDWVVSPMSAWLDRPVFFCERMESGSFLRWDYKTRYPKTDDELYSRVVDAMNLLKIDKCLFVKRSAKPFAYSKLRSTELISFPQSMAREEQYSLWRIEREQESSEVRR